MMVPVGSRLLRSVSSRNAVLLPMMTLSSRLESASARISVGRVIRSRFTVEGICPATNVPGGANTNGPMLKA